MRKNNYAALCTGITLILFMLAATGCGPQRNDAVHQTNDVAGHSSAAPVRSLQHAVLDTYVNTAYGYSLSHNSTNAIHISCMGAGCDEDPIVRAKSDNIDILLTPRGTEITSIGILAIEKDNQTESFSGVPNNLPLEAFVQRAWDTVKNPTASTGTLAHGDSEPSPQNTTFGGKTAYVFFDTSWEVSRKKPRPTIITEHKGVLFIITYPVPETLSDPMELLTVLSSFTFID
jgi:hypothetical protein